MINLVKQNLFLFIKKAQLWLGFFVLLIVFNGCGKRINEYTIHGTTMGTTYSIKIIGTNDQRININGIKSKIDSTLESINRQMSTYIQNSEINQFNSSICKDWISISIEFYNVIVRAQEISELTDGAFDITVGPMIDLWRFSGDLDQNAWQPPSEQEIGEILQFIGFNNIAVGNNSIRKVHPKTQIDLNAIAKGYGVDLVFQLLNDFGYTNIMVEIGGEIRCSGHNKDGDNWKIGIDKPILSVTPGADLHEIINLNNNSLATSGDYRNYFIYNDEIFSHIIDPRTGYPTQNQASSASVIAPDCITADALSTALMVMGLGGIELINSMDDIEAMLILRTGDNKFEIVESYGWRSINKNLN